MPAITALALTAASAAIVGVLAEDRPGLRRNLVLCPFRLTDSAEVHQDTADVIRSLIILRSWP
jgi:hypothetical protein